MADQAEAAALAARIDAAAARIAGAIDRRDARHARLRGEVEAAVATLDGLLAGGAGAGTRADG